MAGQCPSREPLRWYYVTVAERRVWEVSIQARSQAEVAKQAERIAAEDEPDYVDSEPTLVEEVKKYVE